MASPPAPTDVFAEEDNFTIDEAELIHLRIVVPYLQGQIVDLKQLLEAAQRDKTWMQTHISIQQYQIQNLENRLDEAHNAQVSLPTSSSFPIATYSAGFNHTGFKTTGFNTTGPNTTGSNVTSAGPAQARDNIQTTSFPGLPTSSLSAGLFTGNSPRVDTTASSESAQADDGTKPSSPHVPMSPSSALSNTPIVSGKNTTSINSAGSRPPRARDDVETKLGLPTGSGTMAEAALNFLGRSTPIVDAVSPYLASIQFSVLQQPYIDRFETITATEQYRGFSVEELRLEFHTRPNTTAVRVGRLV